MTKPIPEGYHTLTPYLALDDAGDAIEFYKKAFSATEKLRMTRSDGRIGHAEIQIGDSIVMLADESPDIGFKSVRTYGGSPINIMLYVEDVDGVVKRAVEAGAVVVRPVENQFYGDRLGSVRDPYGFTWHIATHVEDLAPEELERRAAKAMSA